MATLNYLALGDSYTIGESVPESQNFPNQLVGQLISVGLAIGPPVVIAKTGWTTGELLSAIEATPGLINNFDLVTLLIGVNNQYRGEAEVTYRTEFRQLLQTAIAYANNDKSHVFVISIPDWGVTTFAKINGRDQNTVSREIDIFNAINKQETEAFGINYTDITPASRIADMDESLLASDGLHPSAKMYKDWVANLAPKVLTVFK